MFKAVVVALVLLGLAGCGAPSKVRFMAAYTPGGSSGPEDPAIEVIKQFTSDALQSYDVERFHLSDQETKFFKFYNKFQKKCRLDFEYMEREDFPPSEYYFYAINILTRSKDQAARDTSILSSASMTLFSVLKDYETGRHRFPQDYEDPRQYQRVLDFQNNAFVAIFKSRRSCL